MNIVSLILATILLTVFATGILLLLVLTERNRLQKTLAVILGLFSLLILLGVINMMRLHDTDENVLAAPLSFRYLFVGLINFIAILSYYMVAAHSNLFTIRNGILFISPILIVLGVYVVWHWSSGVPMNNPYTSLEEIWENRCTTPVILRLLLFLFFILYQGIMIVDMWCLDSLRSKHSVLNLPDAVSNIRWLRMVVMGIMAVMVVYTLLLFIPKPAIVLIFVIVTASVYICFVYNAIARRMYEDTDSWQVTWTILDGWKVQGDLPQPQNKEAESVNTIYKVKNEVSVIIKESAQAEHSQPVATSAIDNLARIDTWMESEKPYCRSGFSPNEIITHFEMLDRAMLVLLLQDRGENPQSYIRRLRIEEACRLIGCEKAVKVSELALIVGFSHHTSFSRAFITVTGDTVLQYMNKMGVKKKLNNMNLVLLFLLAVTFGQGRSQVTELPTGAICDSAVYKTSSCFPENSDFRVSRLVYSNATGMLTI